MRPFIGKLNETFYSGNASNLKHNFYTDNFNKKYLENFLLKLPCVKFDAF